MKKLNGIIVILLLCFFSGYSQSEEETGYGKGYRINFNDDGTKYMRFISWGQFWAQYNDDAPEGTQKLALSVRRARILTWIKFSDKFSMVAHFGLNSLNGDNTGPVGKDASAQLFFHDFWGEYKVSDDLYIGGGLHYWNGISRLNNQSTLNMLTLDNNRSSWSTLGLSDQFARHIGFYVKGKLGKLQYRFALNEANANTLDNDGAPRDVGSATVYRGREVLGSAAAGKVIQGYVDVNLLDQESNALPYKVGTYMGSKKVFNIGAGFFSHSNGVVLPNGEGDDVLLFAADAFYDAPIGDNGSAITAYATYQSNDYGEDFFLGPYATGDMIYSHVGYVLPGDKTKTRFQPYVAYSTRSIDVIEDNANQFKLGANIFFTGHHSKLSFDYTNSKVGDGDATGIFTVQAMIFL
ncbi:hypothetical protein [Winogradskyella sp.]|uniref:hypothetical protein n=1 Tax=Winogradskyella sp. TaxID=1883156 RepID=UPI003F6A8B4E